MKAAVFHGSPRKGNTYKATRIFIDELLKCGDISFTEFFLSKDLPALCTGCTLCLGGLLEKCPNAQYVAPIIDAITKADALIFATPHYGACSMTGSMKNLLDHIDFLVLNTSPREEMFDKKAFIITTGAGTTAAIKPIRNFLRHCGVNRVHSLGFRLLTDKWNKMPQKKQARYEKSLRQSARKFYQTKKGRPYLYSIIWYHLFKFVVKNYVDKDTYAYKLWKDRGYFKKRPF